MRAHAPDSPPNQPVGRRSLFSRVKRPALLLTGLVVMLVVLERWTDIEWRELPDTLARIDAAWLIGLAVLLPLAGFPISVVYLAIGVRFGPFIGLCLVAGLSLIHLSGAFLMARGWLRTWVETWLQHREIAVPRIRKGESVPIVAIAVLVPVLPYFVRNITLGLSGITLRTILVVAVPLYTFRSAVTLFMGDMSTEPTWTRATLLAGLYGVKIGVCALLVWRIRARRKGRKAA